MGNEDNVRSIMQDAGQLLSSDAILSGERPHPRGWGTFARFFETYVGDLGLFTLEGAIRKITSVPPRPDRGVLRVGAAVTDATLARRRRPSATSSTIISHLH
jgi:N-acyl-D-amino-acid deacylase